MDTWWAAAKVVGNDGSDCRVQQFPARRRHGRLRILLVDDDAALLQISRRWLRRHETVAVEDGEAAMRILDNIDGFDVVVSDNRMDGMSGLEFLSYVACTHPRVRRIMHSSSAPALVGELLNEGIIETFVQKPGFGEISRLCDAILESPERG